jgi:hypothetical protein
MKTCYLHLGFHKTATTSFQLSCGNNRDKLLEAGIYYPKFKFSDRKGNRWNHSGNIRRFCKLGGIDKIANNNSKEKNIFFSNIIEYKKILRQDDSLLLSGEGISCMTRSEIEILKQDLLMHGFKIRAFGLVRSPYSFACSAIQQTIKGGKYHSLIGLGNVFSSHITQNIESVLPERCEQIELLLDIFDDSLELFTFQDALKYPNGPISFLFNHIKPSLAEILNDDLKNSDQSLTNIQARLINATNRIIRSKLIGKNKINKRLLGEEMTIIREQTKELSGEKFLLTQEEFSTVEVQYNKTIQRTKAALGPSFIEENINFSGTDVDPNYLIKVFTECVAMLSTEKLRH